MNTGIITYRNYEENVLLNNFFDIDELIRIVSEDKDFKKFSVYNEKGKLTLSTDYRDTEQGADYVFIVSNKVKTNIEILGTTYDAYKTPCLKQKIKKRWCTASYCFKTKKKAYLFIEHHNKRAKFKIGKYIK